MRERMKSLKQKLLTMAVAVFVAAFVVGGINWYQAAYADTQGATPGSAQDPAVSKSYVDQKVAELVKAELAKLPQGGSPGDGQTGGEPGSMAPLEVVVVPLGKTLLVAAGGELIVRAGTAVAVSNDANGLSDMTDGKDIAPGNRVGNNHLILFPRDGRGIKHDPNSKATLTVLVRGGYTLQ